MHPSPIRFHTKTPQLFAVSFIKCFFFFFSFDFSLLRVDALYKYSQRFLLICCFNYCLYFFYYYTLAIDEEIAKAQHTIGQYFISDKNQLYYLSFSLFLHSYLFIFFSFSLNAWVKLTEIDFLQHSYIKVRSDESCKVRVRVTISPKHLKTCRVLYSHKQRVKHCAINA